MHEVSVYEWTTCLRYVIYMSTFNNINLFTPPNTNTITNNSTYLWFPNEKDLHRGFIIWVNFRHNFIHGSFVRERKMPTAIRILLWINNSKPSAGQFTRRAGIFPRCFGRVWRCQYFDWRHLWRHSAMLMLTAHSRSLSSCSTDPLPPHRQPITRSLRIRFAEHRLPINMLTTGVSLSVTTNSFLTDRPPDFGGLTWLPKILRVPMLSTRCSRYHRCLVKMTVL